MLFIDVRKRLQDAIARELHPGETVISAVSGLHCVSEDSERRIYRYGLYVLGHVLLLGLTDKVFVILTDRRMVILTLSNKGFRVVGRSELELSSIESTDLHQSGIYYVVNLETSTGSFRFKFPRYVMHLEDNGERALALTNALLARTRDDEKVPDAVSLLRRNADLRKRGPVVLPTLLGVFLVVPMIFVWWIVAIQSSSTLIGDPDRHSGWLLGLVVLAVLLSPWYPAYRFVRFIVQCFQPKTHPPDGMVETRRA